MIGLSQVAGLILSAGYGAGEKCFDWLDASLCNDAELGDVRDLLVPNPHPAEPRLKVSNLDGRIAWNRTFFSNKSHISVLKCSHKVCANNSSEIVGYTLHF